MIESFSSRWFRVILPICLICFLYLCSFNLFFCATNSLIYSTVCLLHENRSFCEELDRNKSLRRAQISIQKESSQWSLYGTLSFAVIACFLSPVFGSLSDTRNRKLPIVLTILNAILTGLIITVGSIFEGTKICLILYLLANVVNGFGGGSLILISSCFGYATDVFYEREQHVQTIAIIESSLNVGVVTGYVLCTFIFELHGKIWLTLLVHVLLLILALLVSLIFLKNRENTGGLTIPLRSKIIRPFVDIRDLFRELKSNRLLLSFSILLLSMGFYELFRMGSGSVFYLYLHHMSFNDTQYAAYFTCEQLGTSVVLILLAILRRKWRINEFFLSIIGLCLSLIGLILFAFAYNRKEMIFGAVPSMMFAIYFPVCLRVLITRLVPEKDKGKAFSLVALIQTIDTAIGTVACVQIYRASINFFPGLIFLFALGTRLIALVLILIQVFCVSHTSQLTIIVPDYTNEIPILNDDDD